MQRSLAPLGKRSSVAVTVWQISSAVRPKSAADRTTAVAGNVASGLESGRSVVVLTFSFVAIVVVALLASIVVVALDSDAFEPTAEVNFDLAAVGPTHLDLPRGTPFVLPLHVDGLTAPGQLHCCLLRPIGLRAGRLLVVSAYGSGDACPTPTERENRRSSDQKLPGSRHLRIHLLVEQREYDRRG